MFIINNLFSKIVSLEIFTWVVSRALHREIDIPLFSNQNVRCCFLSGTKSVNNCNWMNDRTVLRSFIQRRYTLCVCVRALLVVFCCYLFSCLLHGFSTAEIPVAMKYAKRIRFTFSVSRKALQLKILEKSNFPWKITWNHAYPTSLP